MSCIAKGGSLEGGEGGNEVVIDEKADVLSGKHAKSGLPSVNKNDSSIIEASDNPFACTIDDHQELSNEGLDFDRGLKLPTVQEIDGRFILGEPAGSFFQGCWPAKQKGRSKHREDAVGDIAEYKEITLFAGSLRGSDHYASKTVRQDSYAFGFCGDEGDDFCSQWLIAAISDGVSNSEWSSELADVIAKNAVLITSEAIAAAKGNPDLVDWPSVSAAVQEISRGYCAASAQAIGLSVESLFDFARYWAATAELVVVEASVTGSSRGFWFISICGDGSAYIVNKENGWIQLKQGKDRSEQNVVDNAVSRPLPFPPNSPVVINSHLDQDDCLLLVTDGIGDLLDDLATSAEDSRACQLANFFEKELPKCNSLVHFLKILDTCVFQAGDDRTAILIKSRKQKGLTQ